MKKKSNYLLGFGERLTEPISKPSGGGAKNHPYTFGETKKRLIKQIEKTIEDFSVLPELSCPNDEAVALVTIHPSYLAKSYYPKDLFNAVGLTPIGSMTCSHKIIPREWRESTKIKRGDSGYEKDIYGRTDCWNSARI